MEVRFAEFPANVEAGERLAVDFDLDLAGLFRDVHLRDEGQGQRETEKTMHPPEYIP